jgi:hypothetical protein
MHFGAPHVTLNTADVDLAGKALGLRRSFYTHLEIRPLETETMRRGRQEYLLCLCYC